jgi:hypothetical protein
MAGGMGPVRVVVTAAACVAACSTVAGIGAARASRGVACPPARSASRLTQYGPAAHADIDGDGTTDRVWVAAAPKAPSSCGIFLVARTAAGVTAIVVAGHAAGPASVSLHEGLPRLFALLHLGSDPALEPVVIVNHGAQAVTFAVYRPAAGVLVRMAVPAAMPDALRWEDGTTRFGSVDCAGVGLVRDSFASRRPDGRWDVSRHTYRVQTAFVAQQSFTGVVTKKPAPPNGLPFGSCEGVRAG